MSGGEGDARSARPLLGAEVVVTRPTHSAGPLVNSLKALGAEVIEAPLIELAPPPDPDALKRRLERLKGALEEGLDAEWLLLTSVNAARFTLQALATVTGRDGGETLHDLTRVGLKVACVGDKTARYLSSRGVEVTVTPRRFVAEGLFEALSHEDLNGARVLFPRALKAREWLIPQLVARGAEVELIPAYQTLHARLSPSLKRHLLSAPPRGVRRALTFTSDSTVSSFISQWAPQGEARHELRQGEGSQRPLWRVAMEHAQVCVIGPTVASYLTQRGVRVDAIAEPHNTEGLTQALIQMMGEVAR